MQYNLQKSFVLSLCFKISKCLSKCLCFKILQSFFFFIYISSVTLKLLIKFKITKFYLLKVFNFFLNKLNCCLKSLNLIHLITKTPYFKMNFLKYRYNYFCIASIILFFIVFIN